MHTDIELQLRHLSGDDYGAEYSLELAITRAGSTEEERPIKGRRPVISLNAVELQTKLDDPAAYGAALGARLFADPRTCEAFALAQGYASASNSPLRLRLDLDASDSLVHSICWELLRDPSGSVLGLSNTVLLSRYLPSARGIPPGLPRRDELRALLVVAAPDGLDNYKLAPIDAAAHVASARAALGQVPTTVLARGSGERPASLVNIRAALNEGPQLVIVVGHGTARAGRSYLWLENATGAIDRVEGEALVTTIEQLTQRPLLVLLLLCQSAGLSPDEGTLAALGPRLIEQGVGAVLAMQGNITQETASALLPVLLGELLRDGLIDRAVATARASIQERADWWSPALFMRARAGRLWSETAPPAHSLGMIASALRLPPALPIVGRDEELLHYSAQLEKRGLAMIFGPPGVGKSFLAAALANRHPDTRQVCWFSFNEGGLGELVRCLEAFVALHFPQAMGHQGQTTTQGDSLRERFDALLAQLRGKGFLLCLDNLQLVDSRAKERGEAWARARADLDYVLRRLSLAARQGELRLLATGWSMPSALAALAHPRPLAGLSAPLVGALLADAGVTPPADQVARLAELTAGAPRELTLLANLLAHGTDPALLLAGLEATGDVAGGSVGETQQQEVLDLLTARQQTLLAAMAVLHGEGSRRAIEVVLDERESVQAELQELEAWSILSLHDATEQIYRFDGLLRPYCYRLPSDEERRLMHSRASHYYAEGQERDGLKAIEHAITAEEFGRATRLSEDHFRPMLGRPQAPALRRALAKIDQELLEPLARAELSLVAGTLARAAGERDVAMRSFERAIFLAEHQPNAPAVGVLARALAARGRMLTDSNPDAALAAANQGLAALGTAAYPDERGALLIVKGAALVARGKLAEAQTAFQQAADQIGRGLEPLWIDALSGIATTQYLLGDYQAALASLRRATDVAEEIKDTHRLITIAIDRGVYREALDDWPGALQEYDQALTLAEVSGSPQHRARTHFNRGNLLFKQGKLAQAAAAFDLAISLGGPLFKLSSWCCLADIAVWQGQIATVERCLNEAETLARAASRSPDSEIVRLRAELALLQADTRAARKLAAEAFELAPVEDTYQQGVCLRTQGAAMLAAGSLKTAASTLRRSAGLLKAHYPYEYALTLVPLARARARDGKLTQAETTLGEARAIFERLGACVALESTAL